MEAEIHRADGDYAIKRSEGSDRWLFVDKRTNHRVFFTGVVWRGFKNNVFLRHLSADQRNDDEYMESSGNRVAILNKDSLPEWIINEFEHIDKHGEVTPATDPR